jgi:urease accessory protein
MERSANVGNARVCPAAASLKIYREPLVTVTTALLLLADGRYPAGGHAHSGGLESAVHAGRVRDLPSLESFLRGRLATAGTVAAAFAAAASDRAGCAAALAELDAGLDARTASPALRLASRRQGRALVRAGRVTWPAPVYDALPRQADGPHHPVALGVVASAAGLTAQHAALAAAYGAVSGPASAAVRLLGLDPYPVQALLARLATDCDAVAATAAAHAKLPSVELPAATAPLLDISAEDHASWEVRLFAS